MCGIVGYVGTGRCRRSCSRASRSSSTAATTRPGISVLADGERDSVRAVGNLAAARGASTRPARRRRPSRWPRRRPRPASATRAGRPTAASPRRTPTRTTTPADRVHVVVNGIVENYMELKQELLAAGAELHLRDRRRGDRPPDRPPLDDGDGLVEAVRARLRPLRGHYAFVAVAADEPGVLVGARKECPLVVGRGDGEQFLASGDPRLPRHTRRVQVDRERRDRRRHARRRRVLHRRDGTPVEREVDEVDWDAEAAEKGGYETFMLKEIHEQADAVAETIADRTVRATASTSATSARSTTSCCGRAGAIVVVACGTSYHAGLIGRYAIEEWARVPVEMDIASEYRYRNPVVGPGDLVIGITAVGRDRPTRWPRCAWRASAARRCWRSPTSWARRPRATPTACCSRAPGLEIGVAATKTFVAQVAAMYLLALRLAELRGTLAAERRAELVADLKRIPHCIDEMLERRAEAIERDRRAPLRRRTSSSTSAATSACRSRSRAR